MSPRLEMLEDLVRQQEQHILGLTQQISNLYTLLDNVVRHGPVTDVDTDKMLARISVGPNGEKDKSDWVPYAQIAGAGTGDDNDETKYHCPPSVGQQMTMLAPNGERRQAVLVPLTWSDKATPPAKGADPVFKRGKLKITYGKDKLTIVLGGSSITMTADQLTLISPRLEENP